MAIIAAEPLAGDRELPAAPAVAGRLLTEGSFRGLIESAPDAMVIVGPDGEIVLVNAQTERLFGYRRDELLGEPVELLVPERFRDRHAGHRGHYATDPHPRSMEVGLDLYGLRRDGTEFPVEISLSPLETENGTLVSSAIRDITDRKREQQEALGLIAIIESSTDAIISKDVDGVVVSWNHGAERLYGYTQAEMCGKSISRLVPPGHDDELPELLRQVRAGERIQNYETVRERKDGTQVDVSMTVSPIRDPGGDVVGIATIARDISVRLRYQEQLRFLAEHDALTGTRNRRRFERDVREQVGRARRYGEQAALLIIDLDGFKQINDAHGHGSGDRALKEVATILRRRLRVTDVIARIGGDEFAVLLPYVGTDQADILAGNLRRIIREASIDVGNGIKIALSASIGIALIGKDTDGDDALALADRAMYEDKRRRIGPALPISQ